MEPITPARRKSGRKPPSLFHSLYVSMASIILSLVMLVGTTMAWFTDTTTSAVYTITAGNIGTTNAQVLNPTATVSADNPDIWQALPTTSDEGALFSAAPYTPGTAQTVYLKLQNDGDLPTRYRVSLQLVSAVNDLSDRLQYGYKLFDTQDELIKFAAQDTLAVADTYEKCDILSLHSTNAYAAQGTTCQTDLEKPGEAAYLALSVFMPAESTTTDLSAKQTVQVQLTLIATQLAAENAPEAWDGATATATENLKKADDGAYLITSPADMAGAAAMLRTNVLESCTLRLTTDIDMNNRQWTPIDTNTPVVLDGAGYTICNLNAVGTGNAGMFGTVQNLTATDLTFAGGRAAGTTAGMLAGHADTAILTAVCAQDITVTAPTANPLVGSGSVTETGCNVSNYSVQLQ